MFSTFSQELFINYVRRVSPLLNIYFNNKSTFKNGDTGRPVSREIPGQDH